MEITRIRNLLESDFAIQGKFNIQDDGTVDVDGNVSWHNKSEKKLPIQFGKVSGAFWCHNTNLHTLKGSPISVGKGFYCGTNKLKNLEGAPKYVGVRFNCQANKLTSLQGLPEQIEGKIIIYYDTKLPLLRLLVAKDGVNFSNGIEFDAQRGHAYATKIQKVLNQFAGQGKRGVPSCMVALNNLQKERGIDLSGNMKW